MSGDRNQPGADPNGPPPLDDAALKGKPHHLEARLASLEPELRELFEKALGDKQNYERNYRVADEKARKAETKLTEMLNKEQEAETKRLTEQGEYKELAHKAEAKVRELEEKFSRQAVQSSLEREMLAAGALETDLLSTALQAKYGDELKADPSKAAELVARLKQDKPLLFKADEAPTPAPVAPVVAPSVRPTGQPGIAPQPGVQPTHFNALDRKVPLSQVEAEFRQATKNSTF
jgi:hypothetical protein